MENLNCVIWDTSPAVGMTLKEMKEKINELIDEVNELKIQLSRRTPDRSDPRKVSPYDLSHLINRRGKK